MSHAIQNTRNPDMFDSIPLPAGEYVDGSFALSTENPEIARLYQKCERREHHA